MKRKQLVKFAKDTIQLFGFIAALIGAVWALSPNAPLTAINEALSKASVGFSMTSGEVSGIGIVVAVVGVYAIIKGRP